MRFLSRGLAALLAVFAVSSFAAAGEPYQLDKEYKLVGQRSPVTDPKKVTVQEFFWYGCPVCYGFEPHLDAWLKKKPAYVNFERVPNTLGRDVGELHQRAYYVAMALGVEDKIHTPMFEGLKNVERGDPTLTTPEEIDALFTKVGAAKPGQFLAMYKSFAIDGKIRGADQLAMSYGITGTPTIVVDGRWMTGPGEAGGYDKLPQVMDFLVEKARAERGIAK